MGLALKQRGRKPEERWGWRAVCTRQGQNECSVEQKTEIIVE